MDNNKILVNELTKLILGGNAHVDFADSIKGLPPDKRGIKPEKLPYSIWQLVEHIRIAQWDMLRFCMDPSHQSPKWPDEYWPKEVAPANDSDWDDAITQINNDRDEFIGILEHSDIYAQVPGGSGQSILLEALQMADHTSYHIGEIVAVRRLLDTWKK